MTVPRLSLTIVALLVVPEISWAQGRNVDAARIAALEAQLRAAQARVADLEGTLAALAADVSALKGQTDDAAGARHSGLGAPAERSGSQRGGGQEGYADEILVPDLGGDERDSELSPRPELFVQARYFAKPIDEAGEEDVTRNVSVSRMEVRWAGRVSDRIGMGYELQFHPAAEGATDELLNDAYVEYYANDALTVRAGQFVKPFGFDVQHSSSERESPERAIFVGYFFPGERDRGVMLAANLGRSAGWLNGWSAYAGVFSGNRFFDDNNTDLNYNLRVRKVFDGLPLAIGASLQRGTQILPPGVVGSHSENYAGLDVQYSAGRLGIRGEYVRGAMPSTLLSREPEFTAAFEPGLKSWGAAALFNYCLSEEDDLYWRWDRFDNDPVTGNDIRAFNAGYLRQLGPRSRIGLDYQLKNDVTFNDDALNTKISISWNVTY